MSLTHKKCRPRRVGICKSFCRSLRWHYPDQVQRVGDDLGRPLSWTRPSSPRRLANFTQPKYRTGSPGSQHMYLKVPRSSRSQAEGAPPNGQGDQLMEHSISARNVSPKRGRGDFSRLLNRPRFTGPCPLTHASVTHYICPEIYVDKLVLKY